MKKPLYHLLYTNAPGPDGTGYRHIPVSFADGVDPRPIQKWLETLQQMEPGESEGWAFHSFGFGRSFYPILALVNSSFSPEDHERGRTVLIHAFTLPLGDGEAVGQVGRALYEKAKKFLDDSYNDLQITLESYLKGCRIQNDLEIPQPEPKNLCHLEGRFLRALFHTASQPAKTAPLPGVRLEDLPEQILWAGAALPPRLWLQMRWRVGLQSGTEGFVAQLGEGEESGPASKGTAFYEWLEQALVEKRFDRVRQFSENWEIRDWERLVEAVRTPEAQPAVAALAQPAVEAEAQPAVDSRVSVASEVSEEMKEMTKKQSAAKRDKPAFSHPSKSAADWDEEYQSLQTNLQDYVNLRLTHLRGGDVVPSESVNGSGRAVSPRGYAAWFRAWRPEIYLALVLLLVAWLHRGSWTTSSLPDDGTYQEASQTTAPEPEPGPAPAPAPAPSSGDPLEEWGIFVNENKPLVGPWFKALAKHRELEAQQVNPEVARKFSEWADQLNQNTALASDYHQESLTGIFEYVHARWAKTNGKGNASTDWVTLRPEEAQRNLPALVAELNLADQLDNEVQATDLKVQLAVVRAWLLRQPKP